MIPRSEVLSRALVNGNPAKTKCDSTIMITEADNFEIL